MRLSLLMAGLVVAQAVLAIEDQPVADTLLIDGRILTLDAAQPRVEALAIREGRILALGTTAELRALVGGETTVIDLDGAFAMPGFIEGHGHFIGLGQARMLLDLRGAQSFEAMVEQIAEAVREARPGEWILGRGWHQERWASSELPRYDGVPAHGPLSAVSPDHPVLLVHASGHAVFANAAALAVAGIDRDSEDPPGGTIVRDDRGEPTGFLRQAAQRPLREAVEASERALSPAARRARMLRQIELAAEEALRHGITSFHDQGASFDEIALLAELDDAGALPLRLHVAVRGESNAAMDARLPEFRRVAEGQRMLTVRAIKRQIDGALGTHGAWLLEPYSDLPGSTGLPQVSLEALRETAAIALRHGFQLNTHAIGDRGNREALNVYAEAYARAGPGADLRWRIEHAQNLHPDEVPRFAELGVVASMQGIHAVSDGPWVPQRLGEQRARQRAYVWRSLLDAGARICNGSDAPVEPIDPIASLHASITREMANGRRFFPEQAMRREQALRSYTVDCAWAVFEEQRLGTLEPGKFADIVVLDRDLLEVPEAEIPATRVLMTFVAGELRYRR